MIKNPLFRVIDGLLLKEIRFEVAFHNPRVSFEDSVQKKDVKEVSDLYNRISETFSNKQYFTDEQFPLKLDSRLKCISVVRSELGLVAGIENSSLKNTTKVANATVNESNQTSKFQSTDIAHWFIMFETETPFLVMTELTKWKSSVDSEDSEKNVYGFRVGFFEKNHLKGKYVSTDYARFKGFRKRMKICRLPCKLFTLKSLLEEILVFWMKKKRYNVVSNSCQSFAKSLLFQCIEDCEDDFSVEGCDNEEEEEEGEEEGEIASEKREVAKEITSDFGKKMLQGNVPAKLSWKEMKKLMEQERKFLEFFTGGFTIKISLRRGNVPKNVVILMKKDGSLFGAIYKRSLSIGWKKTFALEYMGQMKKVGEGKDIKVVKEGFGKAFRLKSSMKGKLECSREGDWKNDSEVFL